MYSCIALLTTFHSWHRGRGRKILPGQKVHASVAFCKKPHNPQAMLPSHPSKRSWVQLVGTGRMDDLYWRDDWEDILEMDIFDISSAKECVMKILGSSTNLAVWVHRLKMISSSCRCSKQIVGIIFADTLS